MPQPLQLRHMNGEFNHLHATAGLHSPHVLITQNALQQIWSGEFDLVDTITVLHREAARMESLANSIETNLV